MVRKRRRISVCLTCFVSPVGDGIRVRAGLRSLHSPDLELIASRRRQVVQNDMEVPGDGGQSLAERLDRLVVDVVVARVVRRLTAAD